MEEKILSFEKSVAVVERAAGKKLHLDDEITERLSKLRVRKQIEKPCFYANLSKKKRKKMLVSRQSKRRRPRKKLVPKQKKKHVSRQSKK